MHAELKRHIDAQVAVHLHNDTVIRGRLWHTSGDGLTLDRATVHTAPTDGTPIPGLVVVPTTSVVLVQIVEAP